jgi:Skp family chaperone for outer membrane proteins
LFLIIFSTLGFSHQSLTIGFIDSQKSFESSEEGKKAMLQIREKEERIKNDMAKLDEQIRALEGRLNTQKLTLTEITNEETRFSGPQSRDICRGFDL